MSITLTSTGGLFTRLAKIGVYLEAINVHQAAIRGTYVENIVALYDTLRTPVDNLPGAVNPARKSFQTIYAALKESAEQTILEMVRADVPAKAGTLAVALGEVVRQMTGAQTVKACTIAASAAALSPQAGNGSIVLSTKRGDGLVQENTVAEVAPAICITDAQTSTATAGQEAFQFVGAADEGDPSLDNWPTGSNASALITACDATGSNASGNLLTNSFETFTANVPNNWAVLTGAAGTDFLRDTSAVNVYSGTAALKIVGGGTAPGFTQTFNSAGGTAGTLLPSHSYAVNFAAFCDVVPVAGVLTFDLIDGSGSVIADDAGNNATFTVAVTTMTTSYAMYNGVLRTPRSLPSTVKLRIRVTTGITSGSIMWVDHLSMTPLVALYPGGPGAAIFSGSTPFVLGDGWTITTTNNRGTANLCSTFQALFDRLFGMRAIGLLLPSTGSPSISDW